MKILFVCTGNTCRSPLAMVTAAHYFKNTSLNASFDSAGVNAAVGEPASENALKTAQKHGLSLESHTAKQITTELLKNSDLVLAMTQNHKAYVKELAPETNVHTICEYAGVKGDITDPFGGGLEIYEKCFKQLEEIIISIMVKNRKVAIGCDHGGLKLKSHIVEHLEKRGIPYNDYGTNTPASVDYPVYAELVTNAILSGKCDSGILVCTTGIGISIAANRKKGIRAAVCTDADTVVLTRQHNNANVLCLGEKNTKPVLAAEFTNLFLETPFSYEEKHIRRVNMLEN